MYYRFFIGFLVYLTLIYWVNRNEISVKQFVQILAVTVLAISLMGLYVRATGAYLPGLYGHHTWSLSMAAGSTRVPFLETFAQVGLFLTLTGLAFGGKLRIPAVLFFAACIFIGGGRAGLISSLAGVIVLLFLNRRFVLTAAALASAVLAFASLELIEQVTTDPQVKRFTRVESLEKASVRRYYLYQAGLKEFLDHPFIGVGYGRGTGMRYVEMPWELGATEFIDKAGHATHLAILRHMGLLGYLPFLFIWLYAVKKLIPPALNPGRIWPREYKPYAQFVIVFIIALLIRMLVEGNGSESHLYVYIGLFAAIINEILRARQRLALDSTETAKHHNGTPMLR